MIFEALELIRVELDAYIRSTQTPPNSQGWAVLSSLSNFADIQGDKILISLVNIEEETTLKNTSPYYRTPVGGIGVKNPPIFLNLYILIAVKFQDYTTALKMLAFTIQCFQAKRHFTTANTPTSLDEALTLTLSVTMDFHSLSFEKINQLWGTLGGKQLPFVCYKMRVIEEVAEKQVLPTGVIMEIQGMVQGVPPTIE
jgi:hypothetical protein